jgi:hypothetical protein
LLHPTSLHRNFLQKKKQNPVRTQDEELWCVWSGVQGQRRIKRFKGGDETVWPVSKRVLLQCRLSEEALADPQAKLSVE